MTRARNDREKERWTVGEILSAMSGADYPEYVLGAIDAIQRWMTDVIGGDQFAHESDPLTSLFEGPMEVDIERLFSQLEWVERHADLLPNTKRPEGKPDVVVVNAGPSDFEDSVRLAIDYASLFARGVCRRVWMLSDSFIIGDILRYSAHVRALAEQGVAFRFLLVTPWGWTEIPLIAEMPGSNRLTWRNAAKGPESAPNASDDDRKV